VLPGGGFADGAVWGDIGGGVDVSWINSLCAVRYMSEVPGMGVWQGQAFSEHDGRPRRIRLSVCEGVCGVYGRSQASRIGFAE